MLPEQKILKIYSHPVKRYRNKRRGSIKWYSLFFYGSPSRARTYDPAVNSRMLCQLSYWGIDIWMILKRIIHISYRHRPIFPGSHPPSIFGTNELNYRVRDGNGWTLIVISTDWLWWKSHSIWRNDLLAIPKVKMVTRRRIELLFSPWEGDVLTAWPTGHWWYTIRDSNPGHPD